MTDEKQNRFDCCSVEAVISIDERGQMILPKDIREKMAISPGNKLVVISLGTEGAIWGLFVVKADKFDGMVKNILTPAINSLNNQQEA